jgi:hypothetical protein
VRPLFRRSRATGLACAARARGLRPLRTATSLVHAAVLALPRRNSSCRTTALPTCVAIQGAPDGMEARVREALRPTCRTSGRRIRARSWTATSTWWDSRVPAALLTSGPVRWIAADEAEVRGGFVRVAVVVQPAGLPRRARGRTMGLPGAGRPACRSTMHPNAEQNHPESTIHTRTELRRRSVEGPRLRERARASCSRPPAAEFPTWPSFVPACAHPRSWWGTRRERHLRAPPTSSWTAARCSSAARRRKVTFVHRRLWPAVVRLADRLSKGGLDQISEEHTASAITSGGSRRFPMGPREVAGQAARLSESGAEEHARSWSCFSRRVRADVPSRRPRSRSTYFSGRETIGPRFPSGLPPLVDPPLLQIDHWVAHSRFDSRAERGPRNA